MKGGEEMRVQHFNDAIMEFDGSQLVGKKSTNLLGGPTETNSATNGVPS